MQMDFQKRWLVVALAMLLVGCPGDSDTNETSNVSDITLAEKRQTLFIGPYRVECINSKDEVLACLAAKENKDDDWEPLVSDISGFIFLNGFINIIKVNIFSLDNPKDDEDGLFYTFDDPFTDGLFIRELRIGETFNIPLRRPETSLIFDEVNGVQAVLGSVFFDCIGTLCDMAKSLIDQDMAMVITLEYEGQANAPNLSAIPCADAKATFDQTCDTTIGP